MKPREDSTIIPRRPLLWLAAALLFLVPTMLGSLALGVPLVFLASLLAKFSMEKTDRRLRSLLWKLFLAVAALGAVILTYGSPAGVEPGVSLLVMLASLKILEAHTARDFHVLVMIGWILCLCAFLMSQNFTVALCVFTAFVFLLTALIQFHRRQAPGGTFGPPLRTAGKILLQAMPLVVILFLFFPRGTGALRLRFPGSPADSIGFSGKLSPGTVAALAGSDDLAFRVEFPDGNMPPRSTLYWRGAVLWNGGGLDWEAGEGLGKSQTDERLTIDSVRQRITLEPHAGRWLFALDRPIIAPPGATLAQGQYLHTPRPLTRMRRYEVVSAPRATEKELRPRERNALLRLPATISPEVRQLAQSWIATNAEPRAVVKAALQFFRTQGFVYSIAPGEYGGANAFDDFLFRRKLGFCEHYAGAFATLMRAAGIPARVVVGYLGGQFNQFGDYLLIRQSDAHAWCEVWIPGTGWERVDPTSVIAPERLNLGSLREMQAAATQASAGAGGQSSSTAGSVAQAVDQVRLAWDTLSFAWDTRVMSFDLDGQGEFLTQLRLNDFSGASFLIGIALVLAALLIAYAVSIRWRARPRPDPLKAVYNRFCSKAAALGVCRRESEGPVDYGSRAGDAIPKEAERIRKITQRYVTLRYSPEAPPKLLAQLVSEIDDFAKGHGQT